MSKLIRVVILKAANDLFVINEQFSNEYENVSNAVGGYIEAVQLGSVTRGRNICLWLNEEGKLKNLKPNLVLATIETGKVLDVVVGDVVITSTTTSGDTVGLNDKELEFVRSIYADDIKLPLNTGGFLRKAIYLPEV